MKSTTQHAIITALGVVIFAAIAMITGDGYKDSWLDYISVPFYVTTFVWLFGRLGGVFNIEKWF